MKRIFESKNYPTIMYLAIVIVSILILFNFVNLANQKTHQENKLTSFNIQEFSEKIIIPKEKLYYYLIIEVQLAFIIAVFKKIYRKN